VIVVIAIIALLMAILVPTIESAREAGRKTVCLSNLRQIGLAIQAYANVNRGSIPFGPKAPPVFSATDFYPSTGAPTSLLSLKSGKPVALGLLLDPYLAKQKRVMFCASPDQPTNADAELDKVGVGQAQGSYYFRHTGNTMLFDMPGANVLSPTNIRVANLGSNRNGRKIRALVMDSMFLAHDSLSMWGITSRTHHRQKIVNILYSDGHTESRSNNSKQYTVSLQNYSDALNAFSTILSTFERADEDS
jgi:prepilin-type processing-associated H-X9-DG protein